MTLRVMSLVIFTGNFLDLFDNAFNSIPPDPKTESIRAPNDIIKSIGEIECYDDFTSKISKLRDEVDRSTCRNLSYFVRSCQNTSINTFYVQKDHYNLNDPQEAALIARKSDRYQRNVVRKTFGKARIIFASATIGNIITHASYCTFRDYDESTILTVPKNEPSELKNWFNGLEILEAKNYPQDNEDPIEITAKAALELLNRTQGKTLLLFKSYRDQAKAQRILYSLNREITFIDDSFEPETVQRYVENADIIMASASSRLWEGIDITNLKLEIIFSLPVLSKSISDLPFTLLASRDKTIKWLMYLTTLSLPISLTNKWSTNCCIFILSSWVMSVEVCSRVRAVS